MNFRYVLIRKGKVINRVKQRKAISAIRENPIKYFGKWFDDSLTGNSRGGISTERNA